MKFSSCIELMFTEYPFLERIKKAKEFNFDAVEFWEWDNKDLEKVKKTCEENEITIAVFGAGQAGQMVDPRDNEKVIERMGQAIETANYMDCHNLILTANILQEDRSVKPLDIELTAEEMKDNITQVLMETKDKAEKSGVVLNLEPLNSIVDHKGYFLNDSETGFEIIKEVDSKNVRLLYDIYHLQIMQGNLMDDIEKNYDLIGYFHIADVPGRHEPGTGEINYENIYKKLRALGYKGFIGFEYMPVKSTEDSLKRVREIFDF